MSETVITYVRLPAAAKEEADRQAAKYKTSTAKLIGHALEVYLTDKCGWRPHANTASQLP